MSKKFEGMSESNRNKLLELNEKHNENLIFSKRTTGPRRRIVVIFDEEQAHERQKVRDKKRSVQKKAESKRKANSMDRRKITNLTKRDQARWKLLKEVDRCLEFELCGPKTHAKLVGAIVKRDFNTFESTVKSCLMYALSLALEGKIGKAECQSRSARLEELIQLFDTTNKFEG